MSDPGTDKIYTEYKCERGHKWHRYWSKPPFLRDYGMNCPHCGRLTWYRYKFDNRTDRD